MDGPSQVSDRDLPDLVRQLVAVNQQIAQSLASLEQLYAEEVRRQEERQKKWDERDKKWEEEGLSRNPWLWPGQITNLLAMFAMAALAVAVFVLARR